MKFGRYTFRVRFLTDCRLPRYMGSTLRGGFGWALKKSVCIFKGHNCAECLVAGQCIYARTFEPVPQENLPPHIAASSPPYCFEPPEVMRTYWPLGSTLEFSMVLFGQANEYLPYYIYAVERMGEAGIGLGEEEERCPFLLESVTCGGQELYDPKQLKMTGQPELRDLNSVFVEPGSPSRLKIRLVSPLRMQSDKSFQENLPFQVLVRGILRRVSSLFHLYGRGEPDLDYRGLISRAEDVHQEYASLNWTAHLVHIGKQTTFGLGRFELESRQTDSDCEP